jgi:hypothetical protein
MAARFPWPTLASPLRCVLADIQLDGRPLEEAHIDHNNLRLRLDSAAWERLDCTVTVSTDEVLPEGIGGIRSYVLVASVRSNTRTPFRLEPSGGTSSTGRVSVGSSTVAGTFTMQAQAAADIGDRRRIIGSSDPWTAVLDPSEAPVSPGEPPFEFVWVDFSSPDAPTVAREHPTALSVVDLHPRPRLLLNAGVEGLRSLLHNDHAKLERRRMRDILTTTIARRTTATLFRVAAAEIAANGDDPVRPPSSALLRRTCEAVAQQMPGIGSLDELYERLAAVDGPNVDFWTRIDLAIDAVAESTHKLSTAAREVASG